MKNSVFMAITIASVLLALAGCGKSGSTESPAASGGTVNYDPLGKYDPPINVSWGISSSSVQQFRPGDSYSSNVWTREFKDTLGINLSVGFSADGGSGAYDNQLNLGLASGDLPDILRITNYRIFEQGAQAGLWADLTEIYDQYGNEWMKMVKEKYPDAFAYTTIDGKLYGVPPLNDTRQYAPLLWIRDDWLENLGLTAPTTIDELLEVARAFTFKDPDGNGRNDTYGLALQNDVLSDNFSNIIGFLSAFGIPAFSYSPYFHGPDGKMTYGYLDPRMKDALRLLARMYTEGLIDPEFTVKDVNKITDDLTSGRVGMQYGVHYVCWWGFNGLFSSSGVTAHSYPIPLVPGVTPFLAHQSNMAAGEIVVMSSKHAHPEALIKMLNLHNSLINPYMSEETYNKYDADEQWRLTPALINEPQEPNYQPLLQAALEKGSPDGMPANLISRYYQIKGFAEGTDTRADSYGLWGQYSLGNGMYIVMNDYIPKGWMHASALGAVWPQSLIDNDSSLQKITLQTFTEIITGTKSVDAFDTYVQDWLRAGGQRILEDLDRLYPAK
jgi:putative aldouronate transport system substrate-binding protein